MTKFLQCASDDVENDYVQKSQFMMLVYKAVVRDQMKSLLALNRHENLKPRYHDRKTFVSDSLVQLQRGILHQGLKTKNFDAAKGRDDMVKQSEPCRQILTNLQKIKQNTRFGTENYCKEKMRDFEENLQKSVDLVAARHRVISDVSMSDLTDDERYWLRKKIGWKVSAVTGDAQPDFSIEKL